MNKKPMRNIDSREIAYDVERWRLFQNLRSRAKEIMKQLEGYYIKSVVHGSLARGDVDKGSDIDIFLSNGLSSFRIEAALLGAEIPFKRRILMQATPTYAMKAYIEVDEQTSISFPLMKMRRVERDFYKFGGEISFEALCNDSRTLGVDKRLMLIEPTVNGHRESTILGMEEHVSKRLGISVETVLDRVHALIRRDKTGRTGVFIKRELLPTETFELVLKRLANTNPAVRRRMQKRV